MMMMTIPAVGAVIIPVEVVEAVAATLAAVGVVIPVAVVMMMTKR
jgi:hypothetical protein